MYGVRAAPLSSSSLLSVCIVVLAHIVCVDARGALSVSGAKWCLYTCCPEKPPFHASRFHVSRKLVKMAVVLVVVVLLLFVRGHAYHCVNGLAE